MTVCLEVVDDGMLGGYGWQFVWRLGMIVYFEVAQPSFPVIQRLGKGVNETWKRIIYPREPKNLENV